MKIAIVAATLPEPGRKLGGVEVFIHRLANQLTQDKNHDVTVYSLSDRPADANYAYQRLFPKFAALHKRKLFVWLIFPWLLNLMDWDKAEIVHFFGDEWFYFWRRQPSLRTMNGSALNEALTATSLKRKIAMRLIYPLEHLSVKLATQTVGIGQDAKDIYNLEKIIHIGADQTRFHPGQKTPHPSILFIGTWEGRKRGQFIYEQFVQQIAPQLPEARLVMVSDRVPGSHPQVQAIAFPDDATLAQLYREAWVFAYPSIYEGFGMPYVEALASGTPIVTSPNSGAAMILCQGRYGMMVPDEDFARSILQFLQDHDLRLQWIEKGFERAADFTWKQIGQDYLDTYEGAIAQFHDKQRVKVT
jgi:phosphatidyl-myo-inositol alpha-mannosyltransferase